MKNLALVIIRLCGRLWCRAHGAEIHPNTQIHGFPRIKIRSGGSIRIDEQVTLNCASWSNPLNDGRLTVLHASQGAAIHLMSGSGVSSSRLISYSGISIGRNTLVGAGCLICDSDMHETPLGSSNPVKTSPIDIGNHAFIGANCTILKGVTIGDGAVIGANSVVTRNVPSGSVAVGNPAEVIR